MLPETNGPCKYNGKSAYFEDGFYYTDDKKEILISYNPNFDFPYPSEIRLPSTLKKIENGALEYFSKPFTGLLIPSSVEYIGCRAFRCSSLGTLVFEEPSHLNTIKMSTFEKCKLTTALEIPESVKKIEEYAFKESIISDINLGHIEEICKEAFASSAVENVVLNDINSLAPYAFYKSSIKSLTVNSSNLITIPEHFCGLCEELERVKIYNVNIIKEAAFKSCKNLESINLEDNPLSIIEEDAFTAATNLTSVRIPQTITFIGPCFGCCCNLKNVTFEENLTRSHNLVFGQCVNSNFAPFSYTKIEKLVLPSYVEAFAPYTFSRMSFLKEIEINAPIEAIPNHFCAGDTALKTVKLHPSTKTISSYAFANTALKEIGENFWNVEIFELGCFSSCADLENVFTNKNTEIDRGIFIDCKNIKNIIALSSKLDPFAFKDIKDATILAPNAPDIFFKKLTSNIKPINRINDEKLLEKLSSFMPFKTLSRLSLER